MNEPTHGSITDAVVDALGPGRDRVLWDRALTGFGVRVYPSGARVYVVQTRGPAGTRRTTVGRHGVIGAGEARRRASLVIARVRAGEDLAQRPAPKPAGPTLAALARRYLREHVAVRCKPSTAAQYRRAIERHIVPALGTLPVSAIAQPRRRRPPAFPSRPPGHGQPRGGDALPHDRPGAGLGRRRRGDQPLPRGPKIQGGPARALPHRRRVPALRQSALDELEGTGRVSPHAAAALRLLMLTGCRRNEILTLRWEDVHVDARELRLADSKTGPRTVSLSAEAAQVLSAIPRVAGNPWVIPGTRAGRRLSSIFEPWARVRARAGLDDVRIHDLRHSYASRALALGESLPVIAKLLGHAQIQTTARYTHLTRDAVHDAATRVADQIGEDIFAAAAACPSARPAAGRNGCGGACDACGACSIGRACVARDSIKISAARVAAEIGADILSPRLAGGAPPWAATPAPAS